MLTFRLLDLIGFINAEVCNIARWFCANKKAVNVMKTKFMIFHNEGKDFFFLCRFVTNNTVVKVLKHFGQFS